MRVSLFAPHPEPIHTPQQVTEASPKKSQACPFLSDYRPLQAFFSNFDACTIGTSFDAFR
jgi:hypothetical protein